jgi:hypothetical protein
VPSIRKKSVEIAERVQASPNVTKRFMAWLDNDITVTAIKMQALGTEQND